MPKGRLSPIIDMGGLKILAVQQAVQHRMAREDLAKLIDCHGQEVIDDIH